MAKGFTDWDVPVNINAQTLGEIISRPKYGAAQLAFGTLTGSFGTFQRLVTISGTGVIYGGHVGTSNDASLTGGTVQVIIDGVIIFGETFGSLYFLGARQPHSSLGTIMKLDNIFFNYKMAIANFITFESSFSIDFRGSQIINTTAQAKIFFATI